MLLEFPRNHVLSGLKKIEFLICTLCTYPQSVHTHPLSSFSRKITLPLISKILFISISTIIVFVSSSFVSVGTNHVPHSFLDRNSVLTFPSSSIAVSYCPNRHHWPLSVAVRSSSISVSQGIEESAKSRVCLLLQ